MLQFIRRHRYAVQASVAADGAPQAAVVGIAVSDALEVVFDTLGTSRKAKNLRHEPRMALVVWVYYAAQILLLGAEFTQVQARRSGREIRPARGAQAVHQH